MADKIVELTSEELKEVQGFLKERNIEIQVQFGGPKNQVKVAKGIKIAEEVTLLNDSLIV